MKTRGGIPDAVVLVFCIFLSGCGLTQTTAETPAPALISAVPATQTTLPPLSSPPEHSAIPSITGVTWEPNNHIVNVGIDAWPAEWTSWTLIVDGVEIPVRDEAGAVVARPNAPLEQPPSGLIVGTLPWVTGLEAADFPCCGTLQFSIPEMGLTDAVEYNLVHAGCTTASAKLCTSEWTVHEGDWIIKGTESETIEDAKIIQEGNIYIRDSAVLTLKDSELMIERGDVPTIHVYFFVDPGAKLVIDNSRIYPGPVSGALVCVMNRGQTSIIDSPTSIHYFDMSQGAELKMENSSMIFEIGGLLQVTGGSTSVSNSTVGALGLSVPAGAHLEAAGLKSGTYFEDWKVQDMIPDANYELTMKDVTVLEDDFTGELEHGPYERGWIFFLDRDAHVRLSDSELRKVFIDIRDDTAAFQDLKIGEPSSLEYRDILLEDVVLQGQWPFTISDSDVTITDSNYLFLQPSGASTIRLVNSHMVEFIPRGFSGTMIFENASWTNAGEILGGVDYHSSSNNFKMRGSLTMGIELREHLQWKEARVTREFEVVLSNAQGKPVSGGEIKIGAQSYMTGEDGRTSFSLVFDETNYNQPLTLQAWYSGKIIAQQRIDFFTETPIRLGQ